jgi:hypothetical protein
MTVATTLATIKALPGMTAKHDSDAQEYRVTFTTEAIRAAHIAAKRATGFALVQERAEAVAYYTGDASDALDTARAMSAQGYQA